MKKLMPLLILILVLAFCVTSYAWVIGTGTESGDRISILEDMTVLKHYSGNLVSIIGDINIQNVVDGDVIAIIGNVNIDGKVSGQVIAVPGQVKLTDNAEVDGDVICLGPIIKDPYAKVKGQELKIFNGNFQSGSSYYLLTGIILIIAFSLMSFAVGIVFITLFKKKFQDIFIGINGRFGRIISIGFFALLGASTLFLALFITILIPLAYLALMLFGSLMYSVYVGKLILRTVDFQYNTYLEFVTGLITITLARIILVYITLLGDMIAGGLIFLGFEVLVNSVGLGILIDEKFGKN